MDSTLKRQIELEVLRKLNENENNNNLKIIEKMSNYTDFLQKQFKYITFSLSVIFVVSGLSFVYFFGNNIEKTKEQLIANIDSKIVEYRITEALRKRLEELAIATVDSENVAKIIEVKVDQSAKEISSEIVTDVVRKQLNFSFENLQDIDIEKMMNIAIDDKLENYATRDMIERLSDQMQIIEIQSDKSDRSIIDAIKSIR